MKWLRRLSFALLLTLAQSSAARLSMPGVFGDHMVLQQHRPMVFYGSAPSGATVRVQAGAAQGSTEADSEGRWQLRLPPPEPGAAFEVSVRCADEELRFRDVVAGEVWLISGQSNMEWPLNFLPDSKDDIAGAANAQLRLMLIGHQRRVKADASDVPGRWAPATPETVAGFSAVGFYFGQALQQELKVPVGIIQATWGGSNIEPWIPRDAWLQTQRAGELKPSDMGGGFLWLGSMYNGMVHALTGYTLHGVLWYQGESNVKNGERYLPKFLTLIRGWRAAWQAPQLPFYYAQLAPFEEKLGGAKLPPLWQVQTRVRERVPGTGIVPTQDLNPELNVHPRRKREVAQRFLRLVLAREYGREGLVEGPRLSGLSREGGVLRLRFVDAQGLQVRNEEQATGFEIAGADGVFKPAYARIDGESIVLRSAQVPQPQQARYAWDFELATMANVVNAADLPLLPFSSPP